MFGRIGILFGQLTGAILPPSGNDEPILRMVAHFWPLFERLLSSRHMEDFNLAFATCKFLSQAIQASGLFVLFLHCFVNVSGLTSQLSAGVAAYCARSACHGLLKSFLELASLYLHTKWQI